MTYPDDRATGTPAPGDQPGTRERRHPTTGGEADGLDVDRTLRPAPSDEDGSGVTTLDPAGPELGGNGH